MKKLLGIVVAVLGRTFFSVPSSTRSRSVNGLGVRYERDDRADVELLNDRLCWPNSDAGGFRVRAPPVERLRAISTRRRYPAAASAPSRR